MGVNTDWICQCQQAIVGLDTAPLIYYIEEHPRYLAVVDPFFDALDRGEFMVMTSTVTLLEVLVQPLRSGDTRVIDDYKDILLHAPNVTTFDVNPAIAEKASKLRADYRLRTPDAIQLATALHGGASFFVTNDVRLPEIPSLKMMVLDELIQGN
jgi:predicted nucleic acid-binding protein